MKIPVALLNLKEIIFSILFLIFLYFSDINIEFKTIFFLLFSFIFIHYDFFLINISFKTYVVPIFIIIVFLFITQNQYLQFEMISLDTPSYLVASQNVGLSELPLQRQWESKGPLFLYLYNFISFLSGENLVLFKLFNDVLLFFVTLGLFFTIIKYSQNLKKAFLGSVLFVSLVSYVWYHSEFSELYCLLFISSHFFLISNNEMNSKKIFISSLLLSLSTLINQATFILYLSFFAAIYFKKKKAPNLKEIYLSGVGLLIPHIFFILIYAKFSLLNVYIANYIDIPLNYVGSDKFEFNELLIWLKRYFEYSQLLYLVIIFIISSVIFQLFKRHKLYENHFLILTSVYLIPSFLIYVIAGHSYEHHLFYTLYFISIFSQFVLKEKKLNILAVLILISSLQIFVSSFSSSINNLINIDQIQDSYPLYELSKEIDSYFVDEDYTVLAFDHVLILHYLQKQNVSYLVHPFNNFEDYIIEELTSLSLLKTSTNSHFSYYIEIEPNVIICNSQAIINGNPTRLDSYNCEISDYKDNYFKIDTFIYEDNRKREFFYDPYKEISVFIKKN